MTIYHLFHTISIHLHEIVGCWRHSYIFFYPNFTIHSPFIQVTFKWHIQVTFKWQPGATLFSVLLGIFALVLGRYGGAMDLAIASPVANRNGWDPQNLWQIHEKNQDVDPHVDGKSMVNNEKNHMVNLYRTMVHPPWLDPLRKVGNVGTWN